MHDFLNESAPLPAPDASADGSAATLTAPPPWGPSRDADPGETRYLPERPAPFARPAGPAQLAPNPPSSRPLPLAPAPRLRLDPRTYDRGLACVQCDACLPACPTFAETGLEADNPRGRIAAMLALSDGRLEPTPEVVGHLDGCLDCRACETACPSGVVFHELIEETRDNLRKVRKSTLGERLLRAVLHGVVARPRRLRVALVPVRALKKVGLVQLFRKVGGMALLPEAVGRMERMLPPGRLWPLALPPHSRAGGFHTILNLLHPAGLADSLKPKQTVGLHAGCVGSVLFDGVNVKAAELIAAAGADVLAPPKQSCCGAIHHHGDDAKAARDLARLNIDLFAGCDTITTASAGCGAMLRTYGHLLRDDPTYAVRANAFARRVRDVTEVLHDLNLPRMRHAVERTAAYHEPCHLAHGQGVRREPRALLERIPGLTLVPLAEADTCCGGPGRYPLTEPEMAGRLGTRKLDHLAASGAEVCVTGNAACVMHLRAEAAGRGRAVAFAHPVELLHDAVFGPPARLPLAERIDGFVRDHLVPVKERFIGG